MPRRRGQPTTRHASDTTRRGASSARGRSSAWCRTPRRCRPTPATTSRGRAAWRIPTPANSGLTPNFGPEAAGRLKAANAAYAEYAKTYKNPIGRPRPAHHGYSAGSTSAAMPPSSRRRSSPAPRGTRTPAPTCGRRQNDPEAVEAMHDAALNPLRRAALGPGFLPPKAPGRTGSRAMARRCGRWTR